MDNQASAETLVMIVAIILGAILALSLYFLPWIIAANRNAKHLTLIVLINLFLGATGIGWLAAFILALTSPEKEETMPLQICSHCNTFNKPLVLTCRKCGQPLE
jgi:phage shock protein PspC (stress-responsive transcriptional regulator)